MEIVRMLFDEVVEYLKKSPMFESDYNFIIRLLETSSKLKDTSQIILKKENIIQEQIISKLNDEITEKEIEKIKKEAEKEKKKISEKEIKKQIIENKLISLKLELDGIDIGKRNDLENTFSNSKEEVSVQNITPKKMVVNSKVVTITNNVPLINPIILLNVEIVYKS